MSAPDAAPAAGAPIPATLSPGPVPILRVEHLSMRFGGLVAINNFSFTAGRGEITALIGPNGAGKTTLLAILSGLRRPSAMERVDGNEPATVNFHGNFSVPAVPHRAVRQGWRTRQPPRRTSSEQVRSSTGGRVDAS